MSSFLHDDVSPVRPTGPRRRALPGPSPLPWFPLLVLVATFAAVPIQAQESDAAQRLREEIRGIESGELIVVPQSGQQPLVMSRQDFKLGLQWLVLDVGYHARARGLPFPPDVFEGIQRMVSESKRDTPRYLASRKRDLARITGGPPGPEEPTRSPVAAYCPVAELRDLPCEELRRARADIDRMLSRVADPNERVYLNGWVSLGPTDQRLHLPRLVTREELTMALQRAAIVLPTADHEQEVGRAVRETIEHTDRAVRCLGEIRLKIESLFFSLGATMVLDPETGERRPAETCPL